MFPGMQTRSNDTLRRISDGGPRSDDEIDQEEFIRPVPNHESDRDKLASDDDNDRPGLLDAMTVDYDEEAEAEEDGKYYGAHYELHPDYESYPSAEPEPEDDNDDDAAEARIAFLYGGVLPDSEHVDGDEGDIMPGPSATTDHDVHHWLKGDDVQYIPNVDQRSDSSSSGSCGSESHGSRSPSPERFDDVAEQAEREAEYQRRVAAALERPLSPTPDLDGIPHYASEDIDASFAFTLSLEHKSDDEILAALLGEGHGGFLTHLNPTPPPSPGPVSQNHTAAHPSLAPAEPMVIHPELAKRLDEAKGPRNRLKRTFDGDAFVPDGAGGYMSARTGRHVERPFEADWVQRQELNTMRNLAERIDAGQVVVVVQAGSSQAAQPTSPANDDSQDVDAVDQDIAAQQDAGVCSTSDEEVTSSRQQQAVVNARTSPKRKRTREDEDAAPAEKRRRVRSEEQPGSPAALRLRPRAPTGTRTIAGSSTAATRNTIQLDTAAATAPHPENDGPAVVKPSRRAARRANETSMASTSKLPSASPSRQPPGPVNAGGATRRSSRILAARERAAEAARRAAAPRRRGKRKGKGGA